MTNPLLAAALRGMALALVAPVAAWAQPIPSTDRALTVDDCVTIALRESPKIAEVAAKVRGFEARLAEIEAVYWPKLQALAYLAPMFTVRGSALQPDVERRYGVSDWGPYGRLEALLALPLYTFGRVEAGADAAAARADVERARLAGARGMVALEVHRLYYTHLYALSMLPSLRSGAKIVDEALTRGQALFAAGTGEVTQVDLMKLTYGRTEIARYMRLATDGADLALAALAHTLGRPADPKLQLALTRIPKLPSTSPESLPAQLEQAARQRSEWRQLNRGRDATLSLADAERLANAPVVFVAGQLAASWTPTRDGTDNPYHYDPYNDLSGGVAVGLQWALDPAAARARTQHAEALGAEVAALRRFAETGIPLQVRQAHQSVTRQRALAELGRSGVKATRKWMTFAATAYESGTGEARDLLEGLVAYLQAKRTHYEALRDFHIAAAELRRATGALSQPVDSGL